MQDKNKHIIDDIFRKGMNELPEEKASLSQWNNLKQEFKKEGIQITDGKVNINVLKLSVFSSVAIIIGAIYYYATDRSDTKSRDAATKKEQLQIETKETPNVVTTKIISKTIDLNTETNKNSISNAREVEKEIVASNEASKSKTINRKFNNKPTNLSNNFTPKFQRYHMKIFSVNVDYIDSAASTYFSNYPQTKITLHPSYANVEDYDADIYLVFKGVNSVVRLNAPYWAVDDFISTVNLPIGIKGTIVAIGMGKKDGKVYSSFTPITISKNQTVDFTLTETTFETFMTSLNSLN